MTTCTQRISTVFLIFTSLLGACSKSSGQTSEAAPKPATSVASATPSAAPPVPAAAPADALKIAYSDWPGWVAWEIAIQKGWFKEAGVNVEFKWFDYAPSMEAYTANKVDAVAVTNGDALVTGSSGGKS